LPPQNVTSASTR